MENVIKYRDIMALKVELKKISSHRNKINTKNDK